MGASGFLGAPAMATASETLALAAMEGGWAWSNFCAFNRVPGS